MAELASLANVFTSPEGIKGNWQEVFKNNNPIVVEVGCGRGDYTVNLARRFPDKNFIGLDAKGSRLWRGAKTFDEEGMANGAFIRTLAETITDFFDPGEVSEVWVTFPDPQPKPSREQQRLVSTRFLNLYRQILKPGGSIHLKTDDEGLYEWAIESFEQNPGVKIIRSSNNLYASDVLNEITSIKTSYEARFLKEGKTIKYIEIVLI